MQAIAEYARDAIDKVVLQLHTPGDELINQKVVEGIERSGITPCSEVVISRSWVLMNNLRWLSEALKQGDDICRVFGRSQEESLEHAFRMHAITDRAWRSVLNKNLDKTQFFFARVIFVLSSSIEKRFAADDALSATAFSSADRNKTVEIKDDEVKVDGVVRTVHWGDAKHADCTGKILSVDTKLKGKVKLVDGSEFENPAGGGELGQHPKELQV